MKRRIQVALLSTLLLLAQSSESNFLLDSIIKPLLRTRPVFHLALYNIPFTFQSIGSDDMSKYTGVVVKNGVQVAYDKSGSIVAINDGKAVPIVLGSIPNKQEHIDQLQQAFDREVKEGNIGMFTLNEGWERDSSSLTELLKQNKNLKSYSYPTPDFMPLTMIDLIRFVRDLNHRDQDNLRGVLVHCKAGQGRSATALAAYLVYVIYKAEGYVTVDQIEQYIKLHRPEVSLNKDQKKIVTKFSQELRRFKSLKKMLIHYEDEVEWRDSEVKNMF